MIKAKYLNSIYAGKEYPGDSGYRINRYICLEGDTIISAGDEFTAGGYYLPASPIPVYTLQGKWTEGKSGKSYRADSCTEEIRKDKETIKAYLASGTVKGISPEYAAKIVDKFGVRALDILDSHPERIFEVSGIPIGVLFDLKTAYESERCLAPLLSLLGSIGVGEQTAKRIYENEGCAGAINAVRKDPYLMFRYGVSLQICDKLASMLNLPSNYTGYETAAALWVLKSHENTGDTAMARKDFLSAYREALRSHKSSYLGKEQEYLDRILNERPSPIVAVKDYLYLAETFRTENSVARKVALLSQTKPEGKIGINLEKEILVCEKRHRISLHANQRNAIVTALSSSIAVITGGPGTGKTTVVKIMREIYEKRMGKTMRFLAPTGRAAARMKESSGYDAFTIHKTLGITDTNLLDEEYRMIDEDAVVCDEASMLDIFVARKLFDSIKSGHQIILLGDVNQLPSVGAGKVLSDLISSGNVPVAELTRVYRQSSFSRIFLNCQKIVKGNLSLEEGEDFEVIESNGFEDSAEKMIDVYLKEVEEFGIDEVCCLCPFRRKTASGSISLNRLIQERVNPARPDLPELKHKGTVFREGDRVMNRRNTCDACNGDIGFISRISPSAHRLTVQFPQGTVDYYYDDLEFLELSYAMSIHKSQGSEFKCCITNLLPQHGIMLQMNLLNTAVSRAKTRFVLVGNREAITKAILTKDGINRVSALAPKIKYASNKLRESNKKG